MSKAEFIPELMDTTEKFTVVTYYCNGRSSSGHPPTWRGGIRDYLRKILVSARGIDIGWSDTEAIHISQVVLFRRGTNEEVEMVLDTKMLPCDHN